MLEKIYPELLALMEEIRWLYLHIRLAWLIGLSGGKDSTTITQLIWYALEALPPEERRYPVYVIGSDTLVEEPEMSSRLKVTLHRINIAAQATGMPFSAHQVSPALQDRYWVNLIGRGYPAPTKRFRWCVHRLKIEPANLFIREQVSRFGEVVVVLGAREQESASRAQAMRAHAIPGSILRRHSSLPGARVYTPIAGWSTEQVWTYLLQVPNPWGDQNRDLAALYQMADGECPLVIDTSTPACGSGRGGCYVCTVVQSNHSLQAQYDHGREWVESLLDVREYLAMTVDPEHKYEFRGIRGKDGKVKYTRDGRPSPRCYTMPARKTILELVLAKQEVIQHYHPSRRDEECPDPEMELISLEDLEAIRQIWRVEEGDPEDAVSEVWRRMRGTDPPWPTTGELAPLPQSLIERLTAQGEQQNLPLTAMIRLYAADQLYRHDTPQRERARQAILQVDWRPLEVVEAEARAAYEAAQRRPQQIVLMPQRAGKKRQPSKK